MQTLAGDRVEDDVNHLNEHVENGATARKSYCWTSFPKSAHVH